MSQSGPTSETTFRLLSTFDFDSRLMPTGPSMQAMAFTDPPHSRNDSMPGCYCIGGYCVLIALHCRSPANREYRRPWAILSTISMAPLAPPNWPQPPACRAVDSWRFFPMNWASPSAVTFCGSALNGLQHSLLPGRRSRRRRTMPDFRIWRIFRERCVQPLVRRRAKTCNS